MIRGQKTPVAEKHTPITIPIRAKLHNRFDFEVIDAKTGKVKQRAYAENIILDKYWAQIFTPAVANSHIHVGTGTGTLSASRTSLFTFLAAKVSALSENVVSENEGWFSHKRVAQWTETENQNTSWTEVGIAYGATSTNLTTHALIKDLNGNPITINKGTTDIINVYSTVYAYLPVAGFLSGALTFKFPKGEAVTATSLSGWMMGLASGFPCALFWALKGGEVFPGKGGHYLTTDPFPSSLVPAGASVTRSGSAPTKKLTLTVPRLTAATYNAVTGIKGFMFAYSGISDISDMQLTFPNSAYPYSVITAESIGTGNGSNLDFKTYFPFIKNDGSFVLKKNGVSVDTADYTVDFGEPNGNYLDPHFKIISYTHSTNVPGAYMHQNPGNADPDTCVIVENPYYLKYGIDSYTATGVTVSVADSADGPWTQVSTTVASEYQHKRYWKLHPTGNDSRCYNFVSNDLSAAKDIHFVSGKAPANGDTITADYRTDVIAKDTNHVFDLTIELTLQEKTA